MAGRAVAADELEDIEPDRKSTASDAGTPRWYKEARERGADSRRQQLRKRLQVQGRKVQFEAALASTFKAKEVEKAEVADELPGELGGGVVPALFWKPLEGIVGENGESLPSSPVTRAHDLDEKPVQSDDPILSDKQSGGGRQSVRKMKQPPSPAEDPRQRRRSPRPRPSEPSSSQPLPFARDPPSPRRELPGPPSPRPLPPLPRREPPLVRQESPKPQSPRPLPSDPPSDPPSRQKSPSEPLGKPVTADPPEQEPERRPISRPEDPPWPPPPVVDPVPEPLTRSLQRAFSKPLTPVKQSYKPSGGDESPIDPESWIPDEYDAAIMDLAGPTGGHLWAQSRQAVVAVRSARQKVSALPPDAKRRQQFSFAPAVAMKLIPDYESEVNALPAMPEPLTAKSVKKKKRGLVKQEELAEEKRDVDGFFSEVPTYREVASYAEMIAPPKTPVVPIRMDYRQIVNYRVGPTALEPFASVSLDQFERNMLNICGGYTNMVRQVQALPEDPHFADMINEVRFRFDGAGRLMDDKDDSKLVEAFNNNKEISQKLCEEASKMGSSIPPMRQNLAQKPGTMEAPNTDQYGDPGEDLKSSPPSEHWFHKVKLDILVIRATKLPQSEGLYHCDPYVYVTIVDADPLSEEAVKGGQEWYAKHEQFHGETPVLESNTEPEWRHRIHAEVRPRLNSHIHFRIYDHDAVAAVDRGLGQATVKLTDVEKNLFHGPRPIALEPMNKKSAKEWGALKNTRLFFSIGCEGAAAKLRNQLAGHKEAHSSRVGRARKRGLQPGTAEARRAPGHVEFAVQDEAVDESDSESSASTPKFAPKPRRPRRHARPLVPGDFKEEDD